jgi:hypothetical protein
MDEEDPWPLAVRPNFHGSATLAGLLDFLLAAIVFSFLLPRRCDVCHNRFVSADAALNSAHAPVD